MLLTGILIGVAFVVGIIVGVILTFRWITGGFK